MNIPKQTILDPRLTHSALGLLTRALVLGEGTNAATLVDGFPGGRDAVRRQMRVLKKLGYMRQVVSNGDGGRIQTTNEFSEMPNPEWVTNAEGYRHFAQPQATG